MFERSRTLQILANSGPVCINIPEFGLPSNSPKLEMQVWRGSPGGANLYILEGEVLLPEAQQRLNPPALVDCLMVVPAAGIGRVRIPSDINGFTLFADQNVATPQVVTMRIREIR